jgi:hypothetical protein
MLELRRNNALDKEGRKNYGQIIQSNTPNAFGSAEMKAQK